MASKLKLLLNFLAAHCIQNKRNTKAKDPRDVLALFGAYDLKDVYESDRTIKSPESIDIHPNWNHLTEKYDNDIAMLTFERETCYSSYIQPACIWNSHEEPSPGEGLVAGWGQTRSQVENDKKVPKKISIPLHKNDECFLVTPRLTKLSSPRTFCAGIGNGSSSGVCHGDSGSGLVMKVDGAYILKGIVSSSLTNFDLTCDVTKFAIYTDVVQHKTWINQFLVKKRESKALNMALIQIRCSMLSQHSSRFGRTTKMCSIITEAIQSEDCAIDAKEDSAVEEFKMANNDKIRFLPQNVAEKFPELLTYGAHNCTIKFLNGKHFRNLRKLELLNLYGNQIENIASDTFKDLTSLKELNLRDNKIQFLSSRVFHSQENLIKLYLDKNEIEFLSERIFENLGELKNLELHYNQLTLIPDDLLKYNLKLEFVWLKENQIKFISPTMFEHLIKLQYVDIQFNPCMKKFYWSTSFANMKEDLKNNCRMPF